MASKITKSSLVELNIRGLGVIDSAELELRDGLTVITGETGAGKTMVLTALNLILGAKSDSDLVRRGDERLMVSGKFLLTEDLISRVEDSGAFTEDDCVIISRSVTDQGKSKITLGGIASTATQISELGQELIEIHAQSTSGRLSKPTVQRDLLDSFGDYPQLIQEYSESYLSYNLLQKRVGELQSQIAVRDLEIAKLRDFVDDFARVEPKDGELTELENEINKLGSVEELNSGLLLAMASANNEEGSAISSLIAAKKILDGLAKKDSQLDRIIDRFADLVYDLTETSSALERYLSKLEADPRRFDELQTRKSQILSLIKKYGKGSEKNESFIALLHDAQLASEKIQDLTGGDEKLLQLNSELKALFAQMQSCALLVSERRKTSAQSLSNSITQELSALAMPNAQLSIEVSSKPGLSDSDFTASGLDEVLFLFTSHKDGKLLPLSKVASGGELSRVMLGVEVVLAKSSPIGTYIFDEVDAGVGGKAAVEVGRRLALLARSAQVIVVTHLAQVASWADQHLVVMKSEDGSVTQSDVVEVNGAGRRKEIARLLSGQEDSSTAQEHAGELLELVAKASLGMIG
jgi:DNA repair protein RecN (Recombination protein N)